jgi:hypothetical protein
MAHRRKQFPARHVLLVDGEGVPLVLEVFEGGSSEGWMRWGWLRRGRVLGRRRLSLLEATANDNWRRRRLRVSPACAIYCDKMRTEGIR